MHSAPLEILLTINKQTFAKNY